MTATVLTDGTSDRVAHAPRVVVLPGAVTFTDRAARFRQLTPGHPGGSFLGLMARLVDAQALAYARRRAPIVPDAALAMTREHGMPPLPATSHERDPLWREDLADMLEALPDLATRSGVPTSVTEIEALADRLLAGTQVAEDAAATPFVGAALQVYFARLAASVPVKDLEHVDVQTLCPVCASRPVASVVRTGDSRSGLRYLACGLCGTEWHMARIKCSVCEEDRGVHYYGLERAEGDDEHPAWKAEACDECRTYLKIFYQDRNPHVDAIADDLASLPLDVLLDEQGFARSGPNVLFHPGDG